MAFVMFTVFLFHDSTAQMGRDTIKRMSDYDLGIHYLKQSKQQRTIGWILLGTGLTLSIIGANQVSNDFFDESTGGEALLLIGNLAAIGSIPLFISAAKNKGRAEILLRNQNVPMTGSSGTRVLSVGLAIPFGK